MRISERCMGSDAFGEDADADVKQKLEFLWRHGLPDGRIHWFLWEPEALSCFLSCCILTCSGASHAASAKTSVGPT